jgi:hypothetical protein
VQQGQFVKPFPLPCRKGFYPALLAKGSGSKQPEQVPVYDVHFLHHLRIFPWISEQDGEQGNQADGHGIIEIREYADRIEGSQSGSHKHLCAIGNESLDEA